MEPTASAPEPPRGRHALPARARQCLAAAGHGVGFFVIALGGLGSLTLLLVSATGPAFLAGFALLGPSWEGRAQRTILFGIAVLTLIFFVPLLISGVLTLMRGLANATRRLSADWCGIAIPASYRQRPPERGVRARIRWQLTDPATGRDLLWMVTNGLVGMFLAAAPAVLVVLGFLGITKRVIGDGPLAGAVGPLGGGQLEWLVLSLLIMVAGLGLAPVLLRGYGLLAKATLGPSNAAQLARRVQHLSQTRTETIDTGAAEIRRIERDLHDGAQARLVAMGMTLDAAGQLIDEDPKAARALLLEARDNSAKALADLRNLVRGIHPPVLADRGLAEAIKALALDTPVKVHLASDLTGRPQAPVESAAYFAVSELLANVSKHAKAAQAWVDIRYADGMLKIGVTDDGHGGADPAHGTGLRGIERRLAAFDGVLALSSPPGGPTAVTVEMPCALR
jgi:signal transduction histidine kinase